MSLLLYIALWVLLSLAATPIIGALLVPLEDWSEVPSRRVRQRQVLALRNDKVRGAGDHGTGEVDPPSQYEA